MSLLQAIWWISLGLAVMSVVVMVFLILRRLVIQRRQVWWKTRKSELTTLVFGNLETPEVISDMKDSLSDKDVRLIHEIAHELIGSVRGGTRSNLLAMLEQIGGLDTATGMLTSRDTRLRLQAINNLTLFEDEEAVAALTTALDDPADKVRQAAAGALVNRGTPISARQLIEKLDVEGGVKPRILREIFRKIAPRAVAEFFDILDNEPTETVRLLAIDALGASHDYSAVQVLSAQIEAGSINVRAEVMRSLAAIGHPTALPTVLACLADEAWEVRAQAAICAGRIGLAETQGLLVGLLGDAEWWVCYRAAGALKSMGDAGIASLESASRGTNHAATIARLVLDEGKAA